MTVELVPGAGTPYDQLVAKMRQKPRPPRPKPKKGICQDCLVPLRDRPRSSCLSVEHWFATERVAA